MLYFEEIGLQLNSCDEKFIQSFPWAVSEGKRTNMAPAGHKIVATPLLMFLAPNSEILAPKPF